LPYCSTFIGKWEEYWHILSQKGAILFGEMVYNVCIYDLHKGGRQ